MSRFADHEEDAGYNTAFQDMLFGIIGVIGAVAIILLVLLKPTVEPSVATEEGEPMRGNLHMEIFWPNEVNADIDLWGAAPGQVPVGYSNMHNPILDLIRDDLGDYQDITHLNYEIMSARGLPEGEWAFNVHWYGNRAGVAEIRVDAVLTINYTDSEGKTVGSRVRIEIRDVLLTHQGQEVTLIRFRIGPDGRLVPGSQTNLFRPLRSPVQ